MVLGKNEPERRALYHQRNRTLDGQVVLVWTCGPRVKFTNRDEINPWFESGRDWTLVGELHTEIVGDGFVDTVVPVRHRSSQELAERAALTAAHRAYRKRLY